MPEILRRITLESDDGSVLNLNMALIDTYTIIKTETEYIVLLELRASRSQASAEYYDGLDRIANVFRPKA